VGVAAGEPVRGVDVDEVDGRQGNQVRQALESRADQAGTAVAVVEEQHLVADRMAVLDRARLQLTELAVDGMALSLLFGGDPGVDGRL